MASPMPAKIVLKNATSKTLNDRFTEFARVQAKSPQQVTVTGIRGAEAQLTQASAKNRRLAAQMANRPGVQAALGMAASPVVNNVQNRLGALNRTPRGRGAVTGRMGGGLRGRLGTTPIAKRLSGRGRAGTMQGFGPARGRSLARGNAGPGSMTRGVSRGRGRGQISRGRGRGRGGQTKPASKDALDAELDKYMSKTKGHLDAELDDYMQQAGQD